MSLYIEKTTDELNVLLSNLSQEYDNAKALGLNLDMSRGKPSTDQLDLVMGIMDVLNSTADIRSEDGFDCRNYGLMDGIPEAKRLLANILDAPSENVVVCGNSSLAIMYDTVARSYTHGVLGSTPWSKLDKVKFLCPVPGYDRHFAITENFGIEMINIPMSSTGPDMDMIERLVKDDASIKGVWCVPMYSNPSGITYSDDTVRRFAALEPAASDFRIYWDNAYRIHHIYENSNDTLLSLFDECKKAGHPDYVYEFCSTSKVSFAGAGISAIAASDANLAQIRKTISLQIIGFDKINQLRHVRYFKDIDGLTDHMYKQAEIIRPKFDTVLNILDEGLTGTGLGSWINPKGGYFISFDSMNNCAKSIVAKCLEAGVKLTDAGATYPYKKDPNDCNIRIAPTFPSLKEIEKALNLFVLCVKITGIEKILEDRDE